MSAQIKGLLTKVLHLQISLIGSWQAHDLRDGLFGLRQGAESVGIVRSVHLLQKFESYEVEHKGFLLEDDHNHVFAHLNAKNNLVLIEGDFSPGLLVVAVPDHQFVWLVLVDHNKHV